MHRSILLLAAVVLPVVSSPAGDWPQWRGENRDDVSTETDLLQRWPSKGPKQVWVFDDAGMGYSGYSIVGNTLYTIGARDAEEFVIAVDVATGEEKWSTAVGIILLNGWGDGPRSTPTVDGDRVYAMAGKGNLVCLNAADGKKRWTVSMTEDLGGEIQKWGYTESPLIEGDLVICTPGGKQGTLAALDKMTGKTKWQTKDWTDNAQYASPIAVDWNGARQIIQLTMKNVAGVEAESGDVLWTQEFPGAVAVIPTPIFSEGRVFVAAGYKVGCMAVSLGSGNEIEELYSNKDMVNHHGGVILFDGHLYGYSDGGGWTCMEFDSGDVKWQEKKALGKGAIHYADGCFYLLEEKTGTVVLIDASPRGWEEKGRFVLEPQSEERNTKGKVWTHPVVSNGKLFLRDQQYLHCYDVGSN